MRNKAGIFCMLLGAMLILGALSLFIYNQKEAAQAEHLSAKIISQLTEEIAQSESDGSEPQTYQEPLGTPIEYLSSEAFEMTETEIDGNSYIGYLSIPTLKLELPVMGEWDYAKLKIAPCRYGGSVRGEDLVIMAHNYARHFGNIGQLVMGERVIFTDMDGIVTAYEVVAQDILAPDAVEEITAGNYDLILFTCTYGGKSRVTVYCDRID